MQKLMRGMMKEERGKEYGYLMRMGSYVFFNGMALGETNQINIEAGELIITIA